MSIFNVSELVYSVPGLTEFGIVNCYELIDYNGYCVQLNWRHGQNNYQLKTTLSQLEILKHGIEYIIEELNNLVNIRDTKIKSVIFWTNCKDVR
jgi:hypothetical protein